MSGGLYYNPKKKKKKPSLKDKPKAKPNREFKEKTPQEKAMLEKRREALLKKREAESAYRRGIAEEYMTKDYRDFPARKELE
jgi:hypothetical protein